MQIWMAISTPRFGSMPDLDELRHNMQNFDVEIFRFTDNSRIMSKHVNILHFGTDLDEVRSEIDRIVSFMTEKGFEHTRDKNPVSLNDADMIIMGSDAARFESANDVAEVIIFGRNGLMPYWDVLWYGTDYTPKPVFMPTMSPLCSGRTFAMDEICLIHAHIRRRDDISAMYEIYAPIMILIEGCMDNMMGTWKERAEDKIKAFRRRVECDGRCGHDADLFFAAMAALRRIRNIGVHSFIGMPKDDINKKLEQFKTSTVEFERLAQKYNLKFELPAPISDALTDAHVIVKRQFCMARLALTWIVEYSNLSTKVS